jgi:hypothetical protein
MHAVKIVPPKSELKGFTVHARAIGLWITAPHSDLKCDLVVAHGSALKCDLVVAHGSAGHTGTKERECKGKRELTLSTSAMLHRDSG